MNRFTFILFFALMLRVASAYVITNDTMFVKPYDSFDQAQLGNRFGCYDETYRILMNPQFIIRPRSASASGHSDTDDITNREPQWEIPMIGGVHGTNAVVMQLYPSANGNGNSSTSSNYTYGAMVYRLQFPYMSINKVGVSTQDWTLPTNNIYRIVYSDFPYYSGGGNANAGIFMMGASNAAIQAGYPFIDSWTPLTAVVTAAGTSSSNLFFPNPNGGVPQYDHPMNELHLGRAITDLKVEGQPTNVWTLVADWNSSTPSQTNSCTLTGISRTANSYTGTLMLDRMGMSFDVPDATHTNDCRGIFTYMPSASNALFEVIRFTNAPAGRYLVSLGGVIISTNTATELASGINTFHIYKGPLWAQKMVILDYCRIMRNVSPTNASDQIAGNNYIDNLKSNGTSSFAANTGVNNFIASMLQYEKAMEVLDDTIHAAAQQTPHTLSIVLIPSYGGYR